MTSTRRLGIGVVGASVAVWVCVVALSAQPGQPGQAGPPMAESVFKNVQILKGIPVDQFMATMGFFSASTGLNCSDCHIEESGGSWERYADDNDLKRRTRQMMLMVQNLNRANFGGRQLVTCTTCHRGDSTPAVMPSLNQLYGEPPPDEPGDPFAQAAGQPVPDTLIDKHLAAVGGVQRLAAVTSLVGKGTFSAFSDAETFPLEMQATARGQLALTTTAAAGTSTWVYNGQAGWMTAPATDRPFPLTDITGQELEGAKLEVQAFMPAGIKASLRNLRTGVPMILEDDREVQCVQGDTPGGTVVTLCFDQETALLARMVRYIASPVGRLVTRVDYEAYKDVAGVKVPSKWTVRWLSGRSSYELSDIQANAAVDAARFIRPAAR